MITGEHSTMPVSLPFTPAELAPALPDVVAAILFAFVLAFVTFKPKAAKSRDDAIDEMLAIVGDNAEDKGS